MKNTSRNSSAASCPPVSASSEWRTATPFRVSGRSSTARPAGHGDELADRADQGVSVRREPDGLVIELHIIVTYGLNISTVVRSLVEKVRYTIEEVTGMNVKKVDVFVDSMIS